MSLVGSLEDLGLGDILQIVSLARKSGRLLLSTDGESGRIVLRDGMVHGAVLKGHLEDLRSVLTRAGEVTDADFDRARDTADERGIALDDALCETVGLSQERLDAIRREHVERAVMHMFGWRAGEFSFEVREDPDPEDLELLMSAGVNTQYLAMEATRRRDEGQLLGPDLGDGSDLGDVPDEEPLFSGEDASGDAFPPAHPAASAVDAMALASVRRAASTADADEDTQTGIAAPPEPVAREPETSVEPEPEPEPEPVAIAVEAEPEPDRVGVDPFAAPVEVQESVAAAPVEVAVDVAESGPSTTAPDISETSGTAPRERAPVVAIDRDLTTLEWLKLAVTEDFPRVHIFQRVETGMDRIRQYLARGVAPLVVAAPELLSEGDLPDVLLRRLRGLSAQMPVLALLGPSDPAPRSVDGSVRRPTGLSPDPDHWGAFAQQAIELRAALRSAAGRGTGRSNGRRSDAALEGLRSVSDRLRDPGRHDDVLSLVLEFASRNLSRVAMFMLRDDLAIGMAQRGMARAGGPDDGELSALHFSREELPPIVQRALADRRGVRGPVADSANSEWVDRLGGTAPSEAYVAPIESGGNAVAVLYADNLPIDGPIGDTTALEIVLHEAGLALDRAVLERALADARQGA